MVSKIAAQRFYAMADVIHTSTQISNTHLSRRTSVFNLNTEYNVKIEVSWSI